MKITTLPSAGALKDNGTAVTAGTFVSLSDIFAGYLVFTPATNASGTPYTSFTFQVQDDGGTANGGADTDQTARTMTISVTWVNQAPVGTNNTVTTLENRAYTFATANFGFTDPNNSPANNFLAVEITTLPSAGTLKDNGVAVSAGNFISVSDLNAGKLVFTPATNASGTPYFTFQVQDDGGTANGGANLDPAPKTMTVNVNPPVMTLSNPGIQTNLAGTTANLTAMAYVSNGDPLTFSATGLPAGLSINSTTGDISGTIASNAGSTTPYAVTLEALDAGANVSAFQPFNWKVNPPTVNFSNPGDQTNHAGDTVHLVLMAYASNGDPLTFSATGLQQSGLTINATTGVISGTIASSSTAYEINVTAWDAAAGIYTTIDFDWNVL